MPGNSVHGTNGPKKKRMTKAAWVAVIVLGGLFGAAVWFAFYGWNLVPNEMDTNGYVAMALGILFTVLLGGGLMALLFWSHRKGFDR